MAAISASARPKVIGRYALFEAIASGGMASVRIGRFIGPAGFTRTVAIKQLHPQYAQDPELARMFMDEAHIAARIRHPNVVSVLDVVAEDDELLLVMEYVPGASLSRLLRLAAEKGEHVPPAVAAAIMTGVLNGLHAAHEARDEANEPLGVVHRDVSPQNIMVGTDGIARVVDFGVAKAAGRAQTTRDGQLKGKMAYMAPEQLQGKPIDRRTDVYSSAVVLWETLVGDPLFSGDNDVEVFGKVLAGAQAKPSDVVPDLPRAFDEVTMCGLRLTPSERFQSAREMAQVLARHVTVATPADVSDWVASLAADELALRAAKIADVENGTVVTEAPPAPVVRDLAAAAPNEPLPFTGDADPQTLLMIGRNAAAVAPSARRRRAVAVLAVVLALVGAVVVVRALTKGTDPERVEPAAAALAPEPAKERSAPVVPAVSAPAPTPAPMAAPTLAEPAASALELDVEPVPAGKASRPRARPAAKPAKSKNDCDPPYYFDSAGTKRYKRECS